MPWDPYVDYKLMNCTQAFMSLWRSLKPVVCKIHGYAIAGGSDIALCSDIIVMSEDALIGYPPARLCGCPTTAMWIYRVGVENAERLLFTGEILEQIQNTLHLFFTVCFIHMSVKEWEMLTTSV